MNRIYALLLAVLVVASSLSEHALSKDSIVPANAIVTAADRSPEDRALDANRKPAELLAFLGVQPGAYRRPRCRRRLYDRVAQAGRGRRGTVYGQNSKKLLEMFLEKPWSARLAKPVMNDVVRMDTTIHYGSCARTLMK